MKLIIQLMMTEGQGLREEDSQASTWTAFPRLELMLPGKTEEETFQTFQSKASPRCFGSHLNLALMKKQILDDKAKTIVVMRNPKDVLVSYYHHYKMASYFGYFPGTWNDFFELFKQKHLCAGDMFEYNRAFWELRNHTNVLIVFYEDMKKDCAAVVRQVAGILGKSLTEEAIQNLVKKTSFTNMKNNPNLLENSQEFLDFLDPAKGTYFRKGKVGDWKNYFSKEQVAYVEQRSKEMWEPLGLVFCDEAE